MKPGALWLPVGKQIPIAVTEDEDFTYQRFDDSEPAAWIQVEQVRLEHGLFPTEKRVGLNIPSPRRASAKSHKRVRRVRFEFDQNKVVDFVAIPKLGGTFKVVSKGVEVIPDRAVYENVMIRDIQRKKEKVLNRIFASQRRLHVELIHELERFDRFFCVDSNTYQHSHGRVLITTILEGNSSARTPGGSLLAWRYVVTLLSKAPPKSAELKGWSHAINWLESRSRVEPGIRLGLIVDAELGLLPRIQRREISLFEDFYLPREWELVYATADRGVEEYFPNRMIFEADKFCRAAASRVRRRDLSHLLAQDAPIEFLEGFLVPPSDTWIFPTQ